MGNFLGVEWQICDKMIIKIKRLLKTINVQNNMPGE